jgi:hypothetical protein
MDAAIPVDAKNAPTGIWKTAQNAVSHERPHPSSLMYEEERRKTNPALINLSTDSDQVQTDRSVAHAPFLLFAFAGSPRGQRPLLSRRPSDPVGRSVASPTVV